MTRPIDMEEAARYLSMLETARHRSGERLAKLHEALGLAGEALPLGTRALTWMRLRLAGLDALASDWAGDSLQPALAGARGGGEREAPAPDLDRVVTRLELLESAQGGAVIALTCWVPLIDLPMPEVHLWAGPVEVRPSGAEREALADAWELEESRGGFRRWDVAVALPEGLAVTLEGAEVRLDAFRLDILLADAAGSRLDPETLEAQVGDQVRIAGLLGAEPRDVEIEGSGNVIPFVVNRGGTPWRGVDYPEGNSGLLQASGWLSFEARSGRVEGATYQPGAALVEAEEAGMLDVALAAWETPSGVTAFVDGEPAAKAEWDEAGVIHLEAEAFVPGSAWAVTLLEGPGGELEARLTEA